MSAIAELTRMQQSAIDQLRSGDHSEFLVHFLTTSVLLEVSNLANANLELDAYAAAVVDVITQHAPVDQCAMAFEPLSLPPIGFSFGFATHSMPEVEELRNRAGAHSLDTEGVGVGVLLIPDVPQALAEADFASRVGEQIVAGIGKVVEEERARRGAAAARGERDYGAGARRGGEYGGADDPRDAALAVHGFLQRVQTGDMGDRSIRGHG